MSRLLGIREMLLKTHAALAQLEKAVADDPLSRSLSLVRASLQSRFRELEAKFVDASESIGVDVCSYRIFSDCGAMRIKPIGIALADFQTLVSVTYDAKKYGPKATSNIGTEVVENTAFDLGYVFSGSAGFVLTVKNERLLLVESDMDAAIQTVFEMVKLQSPADIQSFAQQLGPGPMRQLYKWVHTHSQSGLGAGIDWRRGREIRGDVLVQPAEFKALESIIEQISEVIETTIHLTGELVGIDYTGKTFHLQVENGRDLKGHFAEIANIPTSVQVPKRYSATISKISKVVYYKDKEENDYYLLGLNEIVRKQ